MSEDDSLETRQKNELEVLEAIFGEDLHDLRVKAAWNKWSPLNVSITLTPQQGSSGLQEAHAKVDLHIQCSKNYPNEIPQILLENSKGMSNELLNELHLALKQQAKQLLGEVMIFQLAQYVQSFLFRHNKPGFKSFYEEMLTRQKEQEQILELAQKEEKDRERQVILREIQKRQEILKAESRLWRSSVNTDNVEENPNFASRTSVFSTRKCTNSDSSLEHDDACEHKGTQIIEFCNNGSRQIQRGRCIGHSHEAAAVWYLGLDIETGDLFAISQWTISVKPNDFLQLSKQISSIENETYYLIKLKHINLAHYLNIQHHFSSDQSNVVVNILQEFIPGLNCCLFINEQIIVDIDLLRHISRGVLAALEFLHRNNVVHKNVQDSCIFMTNNGIVKLANYSIHKRLFDITMQSNTFTGYNKKTDIYDFGIVILSLIRGCSVTDATVEIPTTVSADLYDFLMRALAKEENERFTAAQLLNHHFIKVPIERISPQCNIDDKEIIQNISPEPTTHDSKSILCTTPGQSRVQSEFEVLQWIGKGAYGDVLKVMNKLDGRLYAIKRIQLNPKSKQLNRKLTREVKLISKLNHENVVRYYNAWIESAVIDGENYEESITSSVSKVSKVVQQKELSLNNDIELLAPPIKDVEWSISYSSKSKPGEVNASSSEESSSEDDDVWGINIVSSNSDSIEFEKDDAISSSKVITENGPSNTELENTNNKQIQFLYIQMEFCEKSTLRTAIDSDLHLDSDRIWRLFREILEGLVHIHQQGMIHRDLKPVNIFLDSNDHVKIGDFGLATTNILGKPGELTHMNKSIQENWVQTNSSLTGQVGTALYTAPELTSNTKTVYNQKVDIYSLGIIFFEMCYPPLNTQMERIHLLGGIRNFNVIFPTGFQESHPKQATIIRWLLNHDVSKRPTSQELIQSELVPPPVLEEEKLREMFRHTLNNPQLKAYKYLMASCFEQPLTPVQDITYDLSLNTTFNVTKLLQLFHYVEQIVLSVFHLHGGKYLPTPLFLPKSKYYEGVDTCVKVMTHSGSIVSIPHDLRVPFARYVAWNNITSIRRYAIERIYREKKIFGFRPRELHECVFDIVTPNPGQFTADAEILYIVNEIIAKLPELKNKSFLIRLNHTLLIEAILLHCGIKDHHDEIYNLLSDAKEVKITKFQMKTHLISLGLSDNCINTFLHLVELEHPFEKIVSLLQIITRKKSTEASFLAKQGLQELKIILQHALSFGVSFNVVICLGLVHNIQQFSGMMCQFVCELKKKRKRSGMDIIANGGRYDSMIANYRSIKEEANMLSKDIKQSCVGISISLDKLVQALQEEGAQLMNKNRCSDVAVASVSKPFIKEKLKIVKELWIAGINCSLIDSTNLKEIEEQCTELNIPHVIILKDDEQGMAIIYSWENDRYQGKLYKQSDVVEGMQRIIRLWNDSVLDNYSNKLESRATFSDHMNEPNVSIVYVTSEKLTSTARKRYENQIKTQLDNISKRLTGEVVVLGLSIEATVIRTLASYLVFESEQDFQKSIKDVLDRHPRHRKYLLEVCDNIYEQITKSTSPIIVIYSISDNYYRLIVI